MSLYDEERLSILSQLKRSVEEVQRVGDNLYKHVTKNNVDDWYLLMSHVRSLKAILDNVNGEIEKSKNKVW